MTKIDPDAGEHTYADHIESISDILDIVSRPDVYLSEILSCSTDPVEHSKVLTYAPLGRSHQGAPRPFPHGLWFRGSSKEHYKPIPSVFRTSYGSEPQLKPQFINEREMFTDIRLRASNIDLRGYNNLELMCLMQHHRLPTRLMDWTESPLVAAFFAVSCFNDRLIPPHSDEGGSASGKTDDGVSNAESDENAAIYVLNAYRLNQYTHLLMQHDSNIFTPQDIDVVIRALMAEHTYRESVFTKINSTDYLSNDFVAEIIQERIRKFKEESHDSNAKTAFLNRLAAPVAVIPRRNHARMDAQLSCFTVHGGKIYYPFEGNKFQHDTWSLMPEPLHLHEINGKFGSKTDELWGDGVDNKTADLWKTAARPASEISPFMKKFLISKKAILRIMIELDRFGINESMIYPDIENQSQHAKTRWSAIGGDRTIFSLPKLCKPMSATDLEEKRSPAIDMSDLYGKPVARK